MHVHHTGDSVTNQDVNFRIMERQRSFLKVTPVCPFVFNNNGACVTHVCRWTEESPYSLVFDELHVQAVVVGGISRNNERCLRCRNSEGEADMHLAGVFHVFRIFLPIGLVVLGHHVENELVDRDRHLGIIGELTGSADLNHLTGRTVELRTKLYLNLVHPALLQRQIGATNLTGEIGIDNHGTIQTLVIDIRVDVLEFHPEREVQGNRNT